MELSNEHLYLTPDELDAGALADPQRSWNAGCKLSNFVLHDGVWHFKLDSAHLDEFRSSLEATVAMPSLGGDERDTSKLRYARGRKLANEMLVLLLARAE